MQGDGTTGDRPGGPAPVGAGADTVLAALAHRLRARSERQQLLTERLRSGELRPGALADLAELAAAARRGIRDGDHILVMAGAAVPDRAGAVGPTPLGQALSAAVAASEAASRTVVPPTPSVSLVASAVGVFGQILSELLAHATAATFPGERLELHTRWGPDGGLVLELLSPRPIPTRMPVEDLDRMLAAGTPQDAVAPQEIGLFLAARLARALGGRLGVRGAPGTGSVSGPVPVAVLALPPSVLGGSGPVGEPAEGRAPAVPAEPAVEPPTGVVAASGPVSTSGADPDGASDRRGAFDLPDAERPAGSERWPNGSGRAGGPSTGSSSVPPWPPVPAESNGLAPGAPPSSQMPGTERTGASGPVRLPVPPPPGQWSPPTPPAPPPPGASPLGPPAANGGPSGPGVSWLSPTSSGPGRPGAGRFPADIGVPADPVAGGAGPSEQMPPTNGTGGAGRFEPGGPPAAPRDRTSEPVEAPPVTEAMPVLGSTPPVELFGPFDSEVPVPIDDLDGTPIFAAVASAWFRDPGTAPGGVPAAAPPNGTNGHGGSGGPGGPGPEAPANWRTVGDAEFDAARSRADRVVEPPVNANGLPMRRPGQQMVPPSRRDVPSITRPPAAAERQPDRVRNRLASYQRGLREGRHRAAEENAATPDDGAAADRNGSAPHGSAQHGSAPHGSAPHGSAPHGRNGHAAG